MYYIMKILMEYLFQIEDKVCGLVRDGGSNVVKAGKLMEYFHFHCSAHKLQVISF